MFTHPIFLIFLASFIFIWSARSCLGPADSNLNSQTQVVVNQGLAADGLDLKSLNSVLKKAKNAKDLEHHLNQPGGINNLDLNADGQVDYIYVTEYGNKSDAHGFSLTLEPEKGEVQEVATIEIFQEGDKAKVQYHGNPQIYGQNYHYSAFHGVGTFLLWSYLLSPHSFYSSPWRHGYYPGNYSSYRTVPRETYQGRTAGRTTRVSRSSSQTLSKSKGLSSPNKGKVANSGIRKSLKNPTATQKAFQVRNQSKSIGSGGFGRSSVNRSSVNRNTSVRGYSTSRSFGGFGK